MVWREFSFGGVFHSTSGDEVVVDLIFSRKKNRLFHIWASIAQHPEFDRMHLIAQFVDHTWGIKWTNTMHLNKHFPMELFSAMSVKKW